MTNFTHVVSYLKPGATRFQTMRRMDVCSNSPIAARSIAQAMLLPEAVAVTIATNLNNRGYRASAVRLLAQ